MSADFVERGASPFGMLAPARLIVQRQSTGGACSGWCKFGIRCRNFRDPNNINAIGLMLEIPDMAKFHEFLQSDENKKAMQEDDVKVETMRMLVEFTP